MTHDPIPGKRFNRAEWLLDPEHAVLVILNPSGRKVHVPVRTGDLDLPGWKADLARLEEAGFTFDLIEGARSV